MAKTPEGAVKKRVKDILRMHGAYQFWPVQMGFGSDTVDCIGARSPDGRMFAIETKARGEKPTPRQKRRLLEIYNAGGAAFVLDGDPDDMLLFDRWARNSTWDRDSPAEKLILKWNIFAAPEVIA